MGIERPLGGTLEDGRSPSPPERLRLMGDDEDLFVLHLCSGTMALDGLIPVPAVSVVSAMSAEAAVQVAAPAVVVASMLGPHVNTGSSREVAQLWQRVGDATAVAVAAVWWLENRQAAAGAARAAVVQPRDNNNNLLLPAPIDFSLGGSGGAFGMAGGGGGLASSGGGVTAPPQLDTGAMAGAAPMGGVDNDMEVDDDDHQWLRCEQVEFRRLRWTSNALLHHRALG